MMIAGEGLHDAHALHDNEGDAVGEGPIFVGSVAIERSAFPEDFIRRRRDDDAWVRIEFLQKRLEQGARRRRG
jgi:hypothetical protein